MSDELLDEATRLADGGALYTEEAIDRTLRALVERVREAEAERDSVQFALDGRRLTALKDNEFLIAQRDEARGKLDAVREYIVRRARRGSSVHPADLVDILDGKV